jgi:hypothetical protein
MVLKGTATFQCEKEEMYENKEDFIDSAGSGNAGYAFANDSTGA